MGWFTSSSSVQKQQLQASLQSNLDLVRSTLREIDTLSNGFESGRTNLHLCAAKAASLGSSIAAEYGRRGQIPVDLKLVSDLLNSLGRNASSTNAALAGFSFSLLDAERRILDTQNLIQKGRLLRPGCQSSSDLVEKAIKRNTFIDSMVPQLSGLHQQLRKIRQECETQNQIIRRVESKYQTLGELEKKFVGTRKKCHDILETQRAEVSGLRVLTATLFDDPSIKERMKGIASKFDESEFTAQKLFAEVDFKLASLRSDLVNPQMTDQQFDTIVDQVQVCLGAFNLAVAATSSNNRSRGQPSALR